VGVGVWDLRDLLTLPTAVELPAVVGALRALAVSQQRNQDCSVITCFLRQVAPWYQHRYPDRGMLPSWQP
jgi:hypothetical protein